MVDYLSNNNELDIFYNRKLSFNNVNELINEFNKLNSCDRVTLSDTLQRQYETFDVSELTSNNINALKETNTYTITTGHQVNLMTGPIYFIYKIASCIKLCEQLNEKHPKHNFVPIYWMNSEDHDIAEINHFNVFGKKVEWNLNWDGASGKMPTESLKEGVFNDLKTTLGDSENATSIINVLQKCYLEEPTLEQATFRFVNHLFGKYGLVVLNQNDRAFKVLAKDLIKAELLSNANEISVNETSKELIKAGYHAQVKPRPLNLFFFSEKGRERIEKLVDGSYNLVNSLKVFTADELFELVETNPENFSFNVVTRALYQQRLLPNLAYIGGGGELAYWLQYKKMFDANKLFFPSLILRNTILWVDSGQKQKINKIGLDNDSLFIDNELLKKYYVKTNTLATLDLTAEKKQLGSLLEIVKTKATKVDASLEKMVEAELSKITNQLEKLEAKMIKAEKRKFETSLNQIDKVKKALFPNNNLQERQVNFIEIWFKYGLNFIDELIEVIEPNQEDFTLLFES
ncbi:UNVERIFIED_CONTAM: hypothetical protein GTU68_023185 [Idotea baltica]|nr:hypothetical protein [Idotea baltica]